MRLIDRESGVLIAFDDLADVEVVAPLDGQIPVYNSVTGFWENQTVAGIGGGEDLTIVNDANVMVTPNQTEGLFLAPLTLTFSWSGQLSVARGGTGASTFGGTNTLLFTTATDTLAALTTQVSSILITSGAGAPSWTTTLPTGVQDNITRVGTLTSGVWNGTDIGFDRIAQITGPVIMGRVTATLGDMSALTGAQVGAMMTLANLVDVLDGIVPTKGYVLVGNGTTWDVLAPGTDGQAIVANSSNANGLGYSAVAGPAGPAGPAGALGPSPAPTYTFDTGTADADPGNGLVRFNSATYSAVTAIYIDDVTTGGIDVTAWYALFDDSTNTALRGQLHFRQRGDESRFAVFNITGASTDAAGYYKFAVAHVASSGPLSGDLSMLFIRTGDKGADGAGSGDVVGPASAVDNNLAAFDSTTGKLIKDSGKVPPSGTIIGHTDTQTLTNKTIVFASNTLTGVAPLASPTFTGTPAAPTASTGTNTTQLATTAFVKQEIDVVKGGVTSAFDTLLEVETAMNLKAPLASPTLTGTPAAPTAAADTSTTQIATTAYVQGEITDREIVGQITGINTQTASYVAALTDKGKVVEMNVGSANTFTVPPNASVAFPTNSYMNVVQLGAGQTTITPGAGVTLRSPSGKLKTTGQYSSATLYKRGTNEWVVAGDLAA